MKKRKFLFKLISAFAVIVFLYTIVATGVFFQKTNEISNYRLASNQKEFVMQVRDKIDTQMTVALNLAQQMKWNARLIKFSQDEERDYYNITKLYEELKIMVNSFSNYGLIFGMQKVSDSFVISSRNTTTTAYYYEELAWNDYHDEAVKSYLADDTAKDALVLHNVASDGVVGRFFTVVKKETISGGEDIVFYISFPTESIIPPLIEEEQRGFAISAHGRFVSLALSDDTGLTEVIRSFNTNQAETPFGYTSVREGNYMLHLVGSMVLPDTKYVYVTQNNAAQGQLNELLQDTLNIFAILTVSGALIIWLIANYTYRPYSRIMQVNEALLEITEKSKLSMKQTFLRDVLFGRLSEHQIKDGRQSVDLDDSRMPVTVVILELKNYKEWSEQLSADGIRKVTAQLRILIRENLAEVQHELLELDVMRFPIIVFGLESEQLEPIMYQLTASIQAGPGLELIAVIGKSVSSLESLQDSYQDALNLMEFRSANSSEAVITMDQLGKLVDADYYYPLDVERELITNIVRGKKDQAIALIEKVAFENLKKRHLSNEVISQLLFSLTATANRIMQQLKWKTEDVFEEGYNIYTDLLSFDTKEQLHRKIIELFKQMTNYHQELEQTGEPLLADQLFEYIHTNYHMDLSLQDIAAHFKLSQGYVGRMFKERTGENFKDYLNMYRVQTAKRLLDEKYIRIDELAKMVGCNNAITFTRMFKKYEGISPSQYGRKTEIV